MRKILVLLAIIVCSLPSLFCGRVFADAPAKVEVVANWAYVYESADIQSAKLATVSFGSEHELFSSTIVLDSQNNQFYNIVFEEGNAYILAGTVGLLPKSTAIIPLLRANTKIKDGLSTISLYIKNDSAYVHYSDMSVNNNSAFRIIEGYKQSSEYTKIQTTLNNEIVTAYVKTNVLAPFGMKKWLKILLICASILLLALLTYIGVRTKRKRS